LFMGHIGIYIAIPLAELLTLIMAIIFLKNNKPDSIIRY